MRLYGDSEMSELPLPLLIIIAVEVLCFAYIVAREFIQRQRRIIANTDPDNIRASDISKFFMIPRWLARFGMNMAVRDGLYEINSGKYRLVIRTKHHDLSD